ncbi:hypothetical protein BGZ91_001563 [Linnemannia elongata]|nr:hypothetical protein BGZ91_001563 [Linnemannia elongata]
MNIDPNQVNASVPPWPTADPSLQRLSIDTKAMDQTHEHLLVIILSRCPELKDMSITHMDELNTSSSPLPSRPAHNLAVLIRNHCPKVYQLSVKYCQGGEPLTMDLIGIESSRSAALLRSVNFVQTSLRIGHAFFTPQSKESRTAIPQKRRHHHQQQQG